MFVCLDSFAWLVRISTARVRSGRSSRCSLLCLVLFPCGARLHRIFCLFACTAVYGHLRVLWGRVTPTVAFHRALGVDLAMTANYTVSGLRPDELFELEKGCFFRGINIFLSTLPSRSMNFLPIFKKKCSWTLDCVGYGVESLWKGTWALLLPSLRAGMLTLKFGRLGNIVRKESQRINENKCIMMRENY